MCCKNKFLELWLNHKQLTFMAENSIKDIIKIIQYIVD